jgi:hypothetical protein
VSGRNLNTTHGGGDSEEGEKKNMPYVNLMTKKVVVLSSSAQFLVRARLLITSLQCRIVK